MMAVLHEGVSVPSHRPETLPPEPVEVVTISGMEVRRWDAYSEVDGGYCLRFDSGEWKNFYKVEIDGQGFWRQQLFGSMDRESAERELVATISFEKRMLNSRRRSDAHKALDELMDDIQRYNIAGGNAPFPEVRIGKFTRRLHRLIYPH